MEFRSLDLQSIMGEDAGLTWATEGEKAGTVADVPVFHLTDKDKEILAMRDEDYKLQTWDELKDLICTHTPSISYLPSHG